MKKILSFVLVLAMIASMMCVSVSAAGTDSNANGAEEFVGTLAGNGVAPGDFPTGDAAKREASVVATLDAVVNNRYFVEIEYKVSNIDIDGEATWNVDTLKYDSTLVYSTDWTVDGEGNPTTPDLKGELDIKIGEFAITNYSDLSVDTTLAANVGVANTGITCKIDDAAGSATATASKTVDAAYKEENVAQGNKEVTVNYEVELNSTDWARSFTQLKNYSGNNYDASAKTITVATITITVAPVN